MKKRNSFFISIVMFILHISNGYAQPNSNFNKNDKTVITDKAIFLLHENYVFPERVEVIEKYIKEKIKNGGYDSLTRLEDFLESLNNDFEEKGKDHHLDISYGPARVKQIIADNKNKSEGKEEKTTGEWLQIIQYENFRLRKVERLDGNIGYFNFLNFTPLALSKQSIAAAMNFLLYSNALIIDLRENGGGYAETMNFILSYFLPSNSPVSELRYRNENKLVKTFTVKDKMINKIPNSIPIYILVSKRTSSAAEAFAYTLQQYKRATIIGEQTKGEGNPGNLFVINDSLYIMIPTTEAINAVSKKSIDGIGVIPDIRIEKTNAFTKALIEANSFLAAKTNNRLLKLLYQWQIPFLENELNPHQLAENIITNIVGEYEENRKIIVENGVLYFVNSSGKYNMKYLGRNTFLVVGKDYRFTFPDFLQPVKSFQVIWNDEGTEEIKRITIKSPTEKDTLPKNK